MKPTVSPKTIFLFFAGILLGAFIDALLNPVAYRTTSSSLEQAEEMKVLLDDPRVAEASLPVTYDLWGRRLVTLNAKGEVVGLISAGPDGILADLPPSLSDVPADDIIVYAK